MKEKQSKCSVFYFLLKLYKDASSLENRLLRDIYMKITIIISTRLFILFPNLIIKESYNWWVTRRVWGFRHQISKAKISKCRSHILRSFRRTPRHCAKWLRNFHNKRTTFSQPKADFAVVHHSAFSLEWYACNGCNSFISTPNRAPFKALDFWLPELRNEI